MNCRIGSISVIHRLFLPVDASLFPSLAAVSEWATGNRYEQPAVSTFLQVADYYLIAQALAGATPS